MNGLRDGMVPVELICVDEGHLVSGKKVRDGRGTLTLADDRWAYCSAGLLNAPHVWQETGGVSLDAIRHADIQRRGRPRG